MEAIHPNEAQLKTLLAEAEYQAIAHHRTAAFEDSRRIATFGTLVQPRGWILQET